MSSETIQTSMRNLWPILTGAGVKSAVLEYSGSGDSGMFEHPRFEPDTVKSDLGDVMVAHQTASSTFNRTSRTWVNSVKWSDMSLFDALVDVASRFVEIYHPGWENNEGGKGQVFIDCENFEIKLEHDEYVVECHHSTHQMEIRPSDLEYMAMETQNLDSSQGERNGNDSGAD